MMNLKHALKYPAIAAISCAVLSADSFAQTNDPVNTTPVGFVNLNITAGTGTSKKATYLSFPLYVTASITGQAVGQITGVTTSTLSNTNAGWTPGTLSQPANPYAVVITSGAAEGRIFLIAANATTGGAVGSPSSANTATTLTVSSIDTASSNDPVNAGVAVGDSYRIVEVETLGGVFPSSSGILGAASAANADSVILTINGTPSTFWYNTAVTPNRWTKVAIGSPDASNTPILPYYGVTYNRLGNTPLSFTVTGTVPVEDRKTQVKNSGATALAQFWPADSTLASLNLQNLPGWAASASISTADTVIMVINGTPSTYWFDGTNWKKQALGSPLANETTVPAGAMIFINKRGAASGYSTLGQSTPYSL